MLDDTLDIVRQHADPPVPVAFDEWNTYVTAKGPDYIEDYNIADALYAGALMNACLRRAGQIKTAACFNLINVMGNYRVTPQWLWEKIPTRGDYWVPVRCNPDTPPRVWKTPTTLVLELMTHYRGSQAVGCQVDSPTMQTPAVGNLPAFDDLLVLDAAATYDPEANIVYLSLVNRDADSEAQFSLSGVRRSGDATLYTVSGDSPMASNTVDSPTNVTVESAVWQADADTRSVPPHSFTMAVIPVARQGT